VIGPSPEPAVTSQKRRLVGASLRGVHKVRRLVRRSRGGVAAPFYLKLRTDSLRTLQIVLSETVDLLGVSWKAHQTFAPKLSPRF
jgi:hypothetical protein